MEISQGVQPYEYILLPASSAQRTADEAAKPTVQIIANDPQLQAVWNTRLDLLEAAFFKPGEVRAPNFVSTRRPTLPADDSEKQESHFALRFEPIGIPNCRSTSGCLSPCRVIQFRPTPAGVRYI